MIFGYLQEYSKKKGANWGTVCNESKLWFGVVLQIVGYDADDLYQAPKDQVPKVESFSFYMVVDRVGNVLHQMTGKVAINRR